MSETQVIHVSLKENPYDIYISPEALSESGKLLCSWCDTHHEGKEPTHAVIITDENVEPLYAIRVGNSLAEAGLEVDLCVITPGEESKSTETAYHLWRKMILLGTDRKTVVVALGGGVIGDLAGFAAATLNRGLKFMQVPTTLLAQVDSAVGGKVGINLPEGKNLVGAFWQPLGVITDPNTLSTLDERQFRAGLGEVVKYGLILDENFFTFLEESVPLIHLRDAAVMSRIIARCCELKAQIVCADERETLGIRAVLNYGHTFAHAVEKLCGFGNVLHGEAVSIGMMAAARLAYSLGRISQDTVIRQLNLLNALHIPTSWPTLDHDAVMNVMMHDKKTEDHALRFILPTRIGECNMVRLEPEEVTGYQGME